MVQMRAQPRRSSPAAAVCSKALVGGIDAGVRPGGRGNPHAARPGAYYWRIWWNSLYVFHPTPARPRWSASARLMGANFRLSSQYPGEGGEPAPHGSVVRLFASCCRRRPRIDAFLGDWAGAFTFKGLPGPTRMVDKSIARLGPGAELDLAGAAGPGTILVSSTLAPKLKSLLLSAACGPSCGPLKKHAARKRPSQRATAKERKYCAIRELCIQSCCRTRCKTSQPRAAS